ncbi:MAG: nitrile hydratase subunit alpha [Proteobacteria bacterium]|nr:nitrile hydratase subunit alpha [Pseudomonadota bacterium]MBI3496856.1 nitrile hydratase subunit alpha [Pseudomonadota bacterium]
MTQHQHGHDHDHPHPTRPDQDGPLTYHQRLETAIRELLIAKGIVTPEEIHRAVEAMDARSPAQGARIVAHAWSDPAYKRRLMTEGGKAVTELGIEVGAYKLIVVENTERVHNLVVCTLCSCYPRAILGLPPDWYKSRAYRSRAVSEPRAVLAEFGTHIPDDVEVRVHDSTADMRYLVLPKRPKGTDNWPEERLADIVTRDTMIGVSEPSID